MLPLVIVRLCLSGMKIPTKGAPLVNPPPQILQAAALTIPGTHAPANYDALVIRHVHNQLVVRQAAPDLSDIRQIGTVPRQKCS